MSIYECVFNIVIEMFTVVIMVIMLNYYDCIPQIKISVLIFGYILIIYHLIWAVCNLIYLFGVLL